jgi:hypothetical protein
MVLIDQNRNLHLNPDLNTWLTHCANVMQRRLTLKEKNFLTRCYRINVVSGIPICYEDFKTVLGDNYRGNFRALKHKLNALFEEVRNGKPKYYKMSGLYLDKELTDRYTGKPISSRIYADLDIILSLTKHEKLQMHGLLFKCKTSGFHQALLEQGHIPGSNNAITLSLPVDKLVDVSVTLYSTEYMLIRLGCTYNPFNVDDYGIISLISLLGKIEYCLKILSKIDFQIEQVSNWRWKHFDLNRDSIHYDFPTDDYTIHHIFGYFQIYNKKFPDGKTRIRAEKQLDIDNTIEEVIHTPIFQKASELERENEK